MERTVEIPQLQLVQQKDEIPESRLRPPIGEHTCPPGLRHLVEKVEMNTAMLKTMLLHSAWRQTPTSKGVNPLTQEERGVGIQAHGELQQR